MDFLNAHDKATVFHEPWWLRVLNETYNHRCDYWVAQEKQNICGILPVVSLRVPLIGRKMIALRYNINAAPRLPIRAYVLPIKASAPAPGSFFEGYRLAKAVWRRLPIPIVDRLGHQITRWVC